MKYVYLNNDVVHEVIEEFDPKFPNVPIQERYSPEFLANCIQAEDNKIPTIGHVKKLNGKFEKPPEIIRPHITPQQRKKQLQDEIAEIDKLIAKEITT